MCSQQLFKVLKVSVVVLSTLQIKDSLPGLFWNSYRRLSSSVPMYEVFFPMCFVTAYHTVDMPDCTSKCDSSPLFICMFIDKLFDNFVFLLFIHCKIHLSDNDPSHLYVMEVVYLIGTFSLVVY